jgi:hypothetical protein
MKSPWELLRRIAYRLPADERSVVLEAIRFAERLTTPPPGIEYAKHPDDLERRRRALLPRPNRYYPGASDFPGLANRARGRNGRAA